MGLGAGYFISVLLNTIVTSNNITMKTNYKLHAALCNIKLGNKVSTELLDVYTRQIYWERKIHLNKQLQNLKLHF